jgi:hypothetical protein
LDIKGKDINFVFMRRNTPEFNNRNKLVRNYVSKLFKKHHQWKADEIFKEAGKKHFISPRTVEAIVKGEGIYTY